MSLNKIIRDRLNNLLETKGFEEMEVAFGLKDKNDNLSDSEKNQFGDMKPLKDGDMKSNFNQSEPKAKSGLDSVKKGAGEEATKYYKEVLEKMKKFQKSDNEKLERSEIGESMEPKKRNAEKSEIEMGMQAPTGTGMEGLRYDDEGNPNYENFEERVDELNDDDSTYNKMKKAGEKYKDYKYGDKYDKSENEYQETPRVRTTVKEDLKYSDVKSENIFKTKNKISSEQQVLNAVNKLPNRIKIDETIFAITDGDNFYRMIWESGEPLITHSKNLNTINESLDKIKHLTNYTPNDNKNKTNETELFHKLFKTVKNK
jgi:hypothetical protein